MSREVDERVVEMRFDNSQFESNVKTTMSTLDRLKAALKFPSKSDALSSIAAGAKSATSGLGNVNNSVGTLKASFSALQVMGVTALANITNSALNAGKRIAGALTLQPIQSGFSEYETQLNSIQTILSNTQSKGTTIDDVTAALDELNKYADQTIYNFTEMTRNIGTFTAAGLGLDESVQAIKGIANLAAVSGSNATQAATAMYQLSQALATGRVSLMDWNSVVNAGMGGEVFQEALKRTARTMGIAVDDMIAKYGSFRDSLTQGQWLTADVLSETLAQIAGAYDEADLRAQGYNDEQIASILELAQTAQDAATKVTSFTKLMETLGEALGSGWTDTWELIFGDFYEARDFWTSISNSLGDIINKSAEARNSVLSGAMDSPWQQVRDQIEGAGGSFDDFEEKIKEVAREHGIAVDSMINDQTTLQDVVESGAIGPDILVEAFQRLTGGMNETGASSEDLSGKLQKMQEIVDQVWHGDFGNGAERMERLAAAGYDYAEVQALVNKTVDGHRLTLEDLSDEQLKTIGYTDEQISTLRELAQQAAETGTPLNELINNMTRPSGRDLFFWSIKNLLEAIIVPMQTFSAAWGDIFTIDSSGIYNLLASFEQFTLGLILSGETLGKFDRAVRGVLSILHILVQFVGGGLRVAFTIISNVLGLFGTNLLDVTAQIGDWAVALDQSISSGNLFVDVMDGLVGIFSDLLRPLQNVIEEFMKIPAVSDAVKTLDGAFSSVSSYIASFNGLSLGDSIVKVFNDIKNALSGITWEGFIDGLYDLNTNVRKAFSKVAQAAKELGPDIVAGLKNGLSDGVKMVMDAAKELGNKIIEVVKALLGIRSPSTVFFEIGKNVVEGFCNGIKFMVGEIVDVANYIIDALGGVFARVDWGTVFGLATGVGAFVILYKFTTALNTAATALKNLSNPLVGVSKILDGANSVMGSFSKYLNEKKWTIRAQAVQTLAISIGILTASVIALSMVDADKLNHAAGILVVLAAALTMVVIALNNFASSGSVDTIKTSAMLFGIAALMGVMTAAISVFSGIPVENINNGIAAIAQLSLIMGLLMGFTQYLGSAKKLKKLAPVFLSISASFMLMSLSVKSLGGMDPAQLQQGADAISMFSLIMIGLMAVTKIMGSGKQLKNVGNVLKSVGVAFLALTAAVAILGSMDPSTLVIGMSVITYFTILMAALMAATRLAGGRDLANLGTTLLAVSGAFTLMAVTVRIIAGISPEDLQRGISAITQFAGIISALMLVTRLVGGGEAVKMGGTLLAMSASIAILAGVAVILGMVDTKQFAKGIVMVGILSIIVDGMVMATRGAADVKGTMVGISIAIGVLAASVAVLSLIDTDKLLASATAMTAVLVALSTVVKAASGLKASKDLVAGLAAMAALLAGVAGVIYLISGIDSTNALPNAIAMSALIVSLGASMKLIGELQSINLKQAGTLAAMTAVMYALSGVIAILQFINPQNVIPNAVALGALLLALSASLKIMASGYGASNLNIGSFVASITAMTLAMYALTGLLAILSTFDASGAIPNVVGLGLLLGEMTGVLAALKLIGIVNPTAIATAGAVLLGITGVVGIVAGLAGALNQLTNGGVADAINSGAEVFTALGEAIGGFIGGILGGAAEGLISGTGSGLESFGTSLSNFMTNLKPFLDGLANVTPEMTTAASNLAGAILTLTASSVIQGITEFLGGGVDWSSLGTQVGILGNALSTFGTATMLVDGAKVSTAAEALKTLVTAMSEIPSSGGLLGGILGGKDYSGFADGMGSIAGALATFDSATKNITPETIGPAANALSTIITTLSQVPDSGGLLQDLVGGKDYTDFATGMEKIGEGLANFCSKISEVSDYGVVGAATNALSTIISTLSTIPSEGGLLDSIFGDGSINYDNFASGLEGIGTALGKYSESITGLNFEQMTSSTEQLGKILSILRNNSKVDDTFAQSLMNINKIVDVGDAIKQYYDKISDVDTSKLTASINSISELSTAIKGMAGMDTSGISIFSNAISQLGQINYEAIESSFGSIDAASIGSRLAETIAEGFKSGAKYMSTSAKAVIVTTKTALLLMVRQFKDVGKKYMVSMSEGIKGGRSSVTAAARAVASAATSALNNVRNSFWKSGNNAAKGFASGISSGSYAASVAARAMANAAVNAANRRLDEHSPSKVFYQIGAYAGQGFRNALLDYARVCGRAASDMASEAVSGAERGFDGFANMFSEIDANPTITPVIDLSDVKNGIDYLNSSFGSNLNYNVRGRANNISRNIYANRQNGTTDDVINELNQLRNDIKKMPVNQYNVNGITYDDGTAVANSIQELIRATRIERRR